MNRIVPYSEVVDCVKQIMSDEFLELEIQKFCKKMENSYLMQMETDCDYFSLAGERDFWRMQMEALIAKHSQAQIARMEEK